ncbi:NIPSNAP family protein [Nocardioides sp.]|uniref:NIPSNAP family protein n=1 Tax=Nocardioides sp. TaxID=35761 RepID=UPI0039E28D5A
MRHYEFRQYDLAPGSRDSVRRYVHEVSKPTFERHGIKMIGPWEVIAGTTNTIRYILEWDSDQHREQAWEAFYADEEYQRGRAEVFQSGEVVLRTHIEFWKDMPLPPSS